MHYRTFKTKKISGNNNNKLKLTGNSLQQFETPTTLKMRSPASLWKACDIVVKIGEFQSILIKFLAYHNLAFYMTFYPNLFAVGLQLFTFFIVNFNVPIFKNNITIILCVYKVRIITVISHTFFT